MGNRYLPTIFNDLEEFCSELSCCGTRERKIPQSLSLSEDESRFYVDAALPGVKSEDIQVTVDPKRRVLSIGGAVKINRDNVKVHFKGASQYSYEIPLSNEIDLDKAAEAVAKDGILTVALSKNKSSQPLNVTVKPA